MKLPERSTPEALQHRQDARADYYTGTKPALIAAGICKASWFPRRLEPEFCKDGRPKTGNNGRQRHRRTYRVEGRKPETRLHYRYQVDDAEVWCVQVAVSDAERQRREADERQRYEEYLRECRERERRQLREREAAEGRARPVVQQLRARYPNITYIRGEIVSTHDCGFRQIITFYARSIDVLIRYGLVTQEMLNAPDCGGYRHGEHFWLSEHEDSSGRYWYVKHYEDESPRERKHFPVTEARQLLKRIAARA